MRWRRARGTLKWLLTVMSCLFLVLVPLTRWLRVQWVEPPPNSSIVIATTGDTIIVNVFGATFRPVSGGFTFWWKTDPVDWHFWFRGGRAGDRYQVLVPIWVLAVASGLASSLLWRIERPERRRRLGLCVKCAYDRHGIAMDAPCPECGAMV